MQPEQLPVPEDLRGKLGWGCASGMGLCPGCPCTGQGILTVSAPWRCSPCPGGSQGLSPGAGPLEAVLLGIAGGCLHLVQAHVGLSLCNHHPIQCWWVLGTCGSSPAACISLPSSPTEMGTSMATTWPPSCPGQLGGITTMSQLLGTARAALSQAGTHTPSPRIHVWPPARPGWGQGEISGCRKGGGDPMTLSHDLPPHLRLL